MGVINLWAYDKNTRDDLFEVYAIRAVKFALKLGQQVTVASPMPESDLVMERIGLHRTCNNILSEFLTESKEYQTPPC